MPVRLSYTNARGDVIILDDDRHSFLGELMGREGFEAPGISLKSVKFGNGTEDVISAAYKQREMTCYFWVETLWLSDFERRFRELKARLVQTGKKPGNWGFLRVMRADGSYVKIDCIYSEGLDSVTYDSTVRRQFSLTFVASDPLFYDEIDTVRKLTTYKAGGFLWFGDDFHFGNSTHFRSSGIMSDVTLFLDAARCYPDIVFHGPAANLMLMNRGADRTIEFHPDFRLLPGERAEVHTKPQGRSVTIFRNGGITENGLTYLSETSSLDWFLENGDNDIGFRNSLNDPAGFCELKYKRGWLSA